MLFRSADINVGLHSFNIVGLPDKSVDESKDRVSSAIKNSGFKPPKAKNQKTVVSLSPSDLKKEGPFFDLAIALSYMLASKYLKFNPEKKIFLGELGLDGALKPIRGALPLVMEAKKAGYEEIYLPKENAIEAALVEGIKIFGANSLKEVMEHINILVSTENSEEKEKIIIPSLKRIDITMRHETHAYSELTMSRSRTDAASGLFIHFTVSTVPLGSLLGTKACDQ